MQAIVQDLLTHYDIRGSGAKTILFVHGWADKLETFRPLIPKLDKDYKTISLDLPGFGQTQAPSQVWDLDDYAKFIAQFLIKIHVDNTYAVVGHSNGGAVAVRGIALGLLKPEKLILLAASGVRDTAKARRLAIKAVAKTGKVLAFWLPTNAKKSLQKKLYGTVGSDMLVTPQLQETFKKTVRQDIQKDAARLTIPTLLIYGEQDKATPVASVGNKLHHLIKGSHLEVIPGADHFVHHAEPGRVSECIREFLAA